MYQSLGSLDSLVYFTLASFLKNLGQLPGDEYTGESQLLGGEYTGESRLPSSEYTGESITNTNNFLKIRKNFKAFLGMSKGKRRSCLIKKTRVKNLMTLSL
jgi:hypothetical protein